MLEQSTPIQLLILALLYAIATLFYGYLGAVSLSIVILVGATYAVFFVENGALIVGVAAMAAPVLVLTALAGVLAGKVAKTKWYFLSLAIFLPFLYWHHSIKIKNDENNAAKAEALDKLNKMPEVLHMAGWSGNSPEISSTTLGPKGSLTGVEFRLDGVIPLYVIFRRSQDAKEWKLSCVTNLPTGMRSIESDVCKQSAIPIGDKKFAHTLEVKPQINMPTQNSQIVLLVTNQSTAIDKVVKINIWSGSKTEPVVLLLASREPVQWDLQHAERPIATVLLMGNSESSIKGGGVVSQYIGNLYAEKTDGKSWEVFNNTIFKLIKNWPNRAEFQSSTDSFTIPGR